MADKDHYEDLAVGHCETFGAYAVTREEVLAFAGSYDPQPFHLDDEAAKHSIFGRVAASGWHTCGMTMRMIADHQLVHRASMGGAGVDRLRWHQPVYPGDVLSVRSTVTARRRSRSRPDMGLVDTRTETLNQNGEVVMSFDATTLVAVRDPDAPITD